MSKEGTTPPKERVNIVYKPATAGANEEVELPLKVLMMGNYTGRASDVPLEDRRPIAVNKESFDQVMRQQDLRLELNVEDKLSRASDAQLPLELTFASLRDFEPEGIVRQVEPLQRLLEVREALRALKGPVGNIPAFRKKIQALLRDATSRQQLAEEIALDAPTAEEG